MTNGAVIAIIVLGWIASSLLVHVINVLIIFRDDDSSDVEETEICMALLGPITLAILVLIFPYFAIQNLPDWWQKRQWEQANKPKPLTLIEEYNKFLNVDKPVEFEIKKKRKTTRRRKNESRN